MCIKPKSVMLPKFEVAGGGSLGEIKVANTKINEWEELTLTSTDKLVSSSQRI
jgi:hypothetical protein